MIRYSEVEYTGHGIADTRLVDMLSGPICAMVWEGRDAVKTGRGMLPTLVFTFGASKIGLIVPSDSHPRCHQPARLEPRHHPW